MGLAALESNVTSDLLKEACYTYNLDWPADDQPFWMKTRSGPLLSVPYPLEQNDAGFLVGRDHTGREFADSDRRPVRGLIEECVDRPLVCPLSLHTFIVGQPFRFRPLKQAIAHCVNHKHADRVWSTCAGDRPLTTA